LASLTESREIQAGGGAASLTPANCAKAALELTAEERELLVEDVPAFSRTLKDPAARERYGELAVAVEAGGRAAGADLLARGDAGADAPDARRRQRHGPDAEKVLTDLFFKTGRGAGLREASRDVTRALSVLEGQTVGTVRVTAAPGKHTIAIETDRAHLTLVVDNGGARVERVEVGG
jgi:hypothetical protein